MNKKHHTNQKSDEYKEFEGLNLFLELTEEEREIAKMLVANTKPIGNKYFWRIKYFILAIKDELDKFFFHRSQ